MFSRRLFTGTPTNVHNLANACAFCHARYLSTSPRKASVLRRDVKPNKPLRWSASHQKEHGLESLLVKHKRIMDWLFQHKRHLSCTFNQAVDVFIRFSECRQSDLGKVLSETMAKLQLNASQISSFALIVSRNPNHEATLTAGKIMTACSDAGNVDAAIFVLDRALEGRVDSLPLNSPQCRNARETLEKAAHESQHSEALNILGQYHGSLGNKETALELYQKSMEQIDRADRGWFSEDFGPLPFDTWSTQHVLPVWHALGNMYVDLGRLNDAFKTFEEGALRGDDPLAYYWAGVLLKKTEEHPDLLKWLHYMGTAAASGHPVAAMKLGDFYNLSPSQLNDHGDGNVKRLLRQQRLPCKLLAREFYIIAGQAGVRQGLVEAAKLYLEAGTESDLKAIASGWLSFAAKGRTYRNSNKHSGDREAVIEAQSLIKRHQLKQYKL